MLILVWMMDHIFPSIKVNKNIKIFDELAPLPLYFKAQFLSLVLCFCVSVPLPGFLWNHQISRDLDSSCIEWWSNPPLTPALNKLINPEKMF